MRLKDKADLASAKCRNCGRRMKTEELQSVGIGLYARPLGLFSCISKGPCRKRQRFINQRCLEFRTQAFREECDYENILYGDDDEHWASIGYAVHVE